jgi:RNA polymerase sigma-70 factor (ECF subfamily)
MGQQIEYVRLVKRAQRGEKEGLEHLTKAVEQRLRLSVYRATLDHDLTNDIVQETILKMLKVLDELKEADRFWPWLYKIAVNKIRLHHRKQTLRKPDARLPVTAEAGADAMSEMVSRELKQIVAKAMARLKPEHRTVLTLRCYEELSYAQIAESMGTSEFAAQMLFTRAKRALKRQLARQGFGKGSLLMALAVFGKMTAPTEAAAATVSVTSATTKVGLAAALTGVLANKTAMVTVAATGLLGVGALVATSGPEGTMAGGGDQLTRNSQLGGQVTGAKDTIEECWYYFPKRHDGPVMMRMMKSDTGGRWSHCDWRQNENANRYFNNGTIYKRNARMWNRDLSVWRLPTDSPKLRKFLSKIEGRTEEVDYTAVRGDGLLVMARSGGNGNGDSLRVIRHHYILDGEQFRYDWPADIKVIDSRDAMHERGWTYFTVKGRIGEERLSGTGRIPFVYAAGAQHSPWLKLNIGARLEIIDDGRQAIVRKGGKVTASYDAGSFFEGLPRPWMGLHTIDTVRRDAAELEVSFETKLDREAERAEVMLSAEQGRLVYTIDMEKDVVERITISAGDQVVGELTFSYLQDINQFGYEFTEPQIGRRYGSLRRKSPGILWLLQIGARDP